MFLHPTTDNSLFQPELRQQAAYLVIQSLLEHLGGLSSDITELFLQDAA